MYFSNKIDAMYSVSSIVTLCSFPKEVFALRQYNYVCMKREL